ncbi:DUF2945 domain-containing protein [Streptomyces sp. SID3343]|uniref:DUF2945 domain-containing protein n=1 Tax=Streptomyces sp. SID3343 TaxID=2690260 RepID=UPI00136D2523|nr:DUF2945 domain-containing protein [Streptomyces sp. SID3343]MYW01623.1 HVA1 family protein [Streptomyces sp. SID3343]
MGTSSKPHKGDRVGWRSHGQQVLGKVTRILTRPTRAAGRRVVASRDELQYEVKSAKTGRKAVHRPGALRRIKRGDS